MLRDQQLHQYWTINVRSFRGTLPLVMFLAYIGDWYLVKQRLINRFNRLWSGRKKVSNVHFFASATLGGEFVDKDFQKRQLLNLLTQNFLSSGSVRLVIIDPFKVVSSTCLPHDKSLVKEPLRHCVYMSSSQCRGTPTCTGWRLELQGVTASSSPKTGCADFVFMQTDVVCRDGEPINVWD